MPYKNYLLLLADDDPDDQFLFMQALEELAIHQAPIVVSDGQQLLDYLRDAFVLPDLIFLDINMPRLNGLKALEEIKKTFTLSHLPVVILSTTNDPFTVRRACELGASLYAIKPANFEMLVQLVEKILSHDISGLLKNRRQDEFIIKMPVH